jgi:aprataxin
MMNTNPATYEKLLKAPLSCFRCNKEMKNMPTLKAHLQEEWELLAKRERLKAENGKKLGVGRKQLSEAGPAQLEENE